MKRIVIFTLLLMGSPVFSQEKRKALESPDVRAAHDVWQKDRAKALKAADDWYIQRLRRLKSAADGRNFELASAIGQEIAHFEFTKMLTSKKWKWTRHGDASSVRFMEDGRVIHPSFTAIWTIISPWRIVLMLPDGSVAGLVYDPSDETFSCRDFDASDGLKFEEE